MAGRRHNMDQQRVTAVMPVSDVQETNLPNMICHFYSSSQLLNVLQGTVIPWVFRLYMEIYTSLSEWIILCTGGQTWYNYLNTTYISVDHETFHSKGGRRAIFQG